jgi:hypothetical protein
MKVRYANGEVSSVRNDLGRELVRAGIAVILEPETESEVKQKGSIAVAPDGTVLSPGEPAYRLPKWQPTVKPNFVWSIDLVWSDAGQTKEWLAIRRDTPHGNLVDTSYCMAHPESVHDRKDHTGAPFCSAFGCRVPEEILEEYRTRYKRNEHQRHPFSTKQPIRHHVSEQADKTRIETTAHATGIVAEQNGRRMLEKMR